MSDTGKPSSNLGILSLFLCHCLGLRDTSGDTLQVDRERICSDPRIGFLMNIVVQMLAKARDQWSG